MDTGKRNYFSFDKNSCKEDKILHQKQDIRTNTDTTVLVKLYRLLGKFKARKNVTISNRFILRRAKTLKNIFTSQKYLRTFCYYKRN